MISISKKITYNTVVSIVARFINAALSFIIIGYLTRYLGQNGFGQYTTVLAFLSIFTILADLGLYSICVRDISRPGADEKKIVSNAFTLRFFAGILFFAAAPLVSLFFPYSSEIKLGILAGAAGFWLLSNNQVLMGVFQKYLRLDKVALSEVLSRLVQLVLVVFFIWRNFGFLSIIGALVAGAFFNFVFVFIFVRKYVPLSFQFDFSFWRRLIKEALPLGLAAILVMVYFKLDTVMLSLMKSQAEVGIYGLSYKILEGLIFFPTMFVGLIMPIMSRYALNDKIKFKDITQKILDILVILIVPLIVGTFFLSAPIIILIGGREFFPSAGVLNVLIIAAGLIFLGALFSNMIISLGKQKVLAYVYGLGALVNVFTNLIFIPKYSYYGAAGTTVLTELLVTALMLAIIYQTIKIYPSLIAVLKSIFAAFIMSLILYFLAHFNLFILIVLAVFVYFGVLYLIGGISIRAIIKI